MQNITSNARPAATTGRLTFQPINPTAYSRNASLPADYPVLVEDNGDGTSTAYAKVDTRKPDYKATLSASDLTFTQ